jgi:hypothetical protein
VKLNTKADYDAYREEQRQLDALYQIHYDAALAHDEAIEQKKSKATIRRLAHRTEVTKAAFADRWSVIRQRRGFPGM